jgi:transforming growth factor-beta-induced protein
MEYAVMKNWLIKMLATMSTAALVSACGGSDDPAPNLAQVAQQQGFTALVAAATKANLVTALSDPAANLTVLGPTDAAFATLATRLGFASATAMVNALDGPTLAKILQYHVLPSRKTAADLAAGGASQPTLYSFAGSAASLAVKTTGGVKFGDAVLTDATVTIADVTASNGVFHAIDKVLVPPGVLNVVQMAQANPTAFSTLVSAVVSANLASTLSGAGPFTVFAPTNDAFAAIASTVAGLTTQQLTTVLTYHVVGAQVLSSGIPFGTPVATLSGQNITINAGTAPVIATITDTTATRANIVAVDVRASNGVIHVVNKVLLPSLAN